LVHGSDVRVGLVAAALLGLPIGLACEGSEVGEPLGREGAHEHGVPRVGMVVSGRERDHRRR
jgi:hypothetical protein